MPDGQRGKCTASSAPGGVVIATADNQLAALDHYAQRGNLDELEEFVHRGKTHWLTADEQERFELTTFTPASLRQAVRAGRSDSGKVDRQIDSSRATVQKPARTARGDRAVCCAWKQN